MASKTTLTAKNLEALGAEHLAALLIEISTGNANAKRRLRLELAGVESPAKLVHEIRKRLTAIGTSTTFVGWRSQKAFVSDLQTQRRLIAEQVALAAPIDALDLLWQFIGFGNEVLERTTDTSGEVLDIFRQACRDIGIVAKSANPEIEDLAGQVADATLHNGYGQNDDLIAGLVDALGPAGLLELRTRLTGLSQDSEARTPVRTRKTSRWRRGRKLLRESVRRRSRTASLHRALEAIADGLGDVEAYIALQTDTREPQIALDIARRLLKAGRAEDALTRLDQARLSTKEPLPEGWERTRLQALEAAGRSDEAQAFRIATFHRSLNGDYLRDYLKRFADFDDIEAEDAALDVVEVFKDVHAALTFLVQWPALDRAARVVLKRAGEIDGHNTDTLLPAVEKLSVKYPLAASVLLRKMVDSVIASGRTAAYEDAADWMVQAERLAIRIEDFGDLGDHEDYLANLRTTYSRRSDFWAFLDMSRR